MISTSLTLPRWKPCGSGISTISRPGRTPSVGLKLPDLLSNFVPAAVNAIIDAFPGDPDNQAKALRWVLRGLLPDRAIRKVKTDLEVSENAKVRE